MSEKRTCGTCRLCCKLVPTWEVGTGPDGQPYEFAKPARQWCKHAGPGGCAIYTSPAKPWTCRTWSCMWLMGWGSDELRPDRSRVVLALERQLDQTHLVLYADRAGAPYTLAMGALVEFALRNMPGVVAALVLEPGFTRKRWSLSEGLAFVAYPEGSRPDMPAGPAHADPERVVMRKLLGDAAVDAPSIDVHELDAAMRRGHAEMGPQASWSDFVARTLAELREAAEQR